MHGFRPSGGHGGAPLMNLRMAIGQSEPASAIVVGSRIIDHGTAKIGIEKSRIVNAVWMFVHEDPCVSWPGIIELRGLRVMLVTTIPGTPRSVAWPDADIP